MSSITESPELAQLDGFISELAKDREARCELLREHLVTAREYLLGAMTVEYRFNLEMASQTLNGVGDKSVRDRLRHFIEQEIKPPQRAAKEKNRTS